MLTHSAHSWGQVLPAQLEEGQGVVTRHVLDVAVETLGSCKFGGWGWGVMEWQRRSSQRLCSTGGCGDGGVGIFLFDKQETRLA